MGRKEKINLLFVLIQLSTGGAEKIVLDLARNLNQSMFNIYVAFFSDGILRKSFSEVSQGLFNVPKKSGFDLGAMFQLCRIIQRMNIDLINAHHYMPFFYSYPGSKIVHNRKLIYTEHSVPEVEAILRSNHKYLCNFMLRRTDAVVGVSGEIAESFTKEFTIHSQKIKSIINGLDIDRFNTATDRNQVRSKWGIRPEHFVIGTVANFRKVKNHICLIRVFNQLCTIYPHIRLVLVGRGYSEDMENSEEELRHLIKIYNLGERVIFTGYRDDVPTILRMFDVFCLPSFSEGLPVSILEAMAARVPIVGSNVGGIREVVSPEETGLLFPSNNENSLSEAIDRLIKSRDLRNKLSNNAFIFVSQTHGLRDWVSAYERLFESV